MKIVSLSSVVKQTSGKSGKKGGGLGVTTLYSSGKLVREGLKNVGSYSPGWTIHADIRFDIRKITHVRVELSVQPRISIVNFALWYAQHRYPSGFHVNIGSTNIRARFSTDIRGCTDNSARTSVFFTDHGYPHGQFDQGAQGFFNLY